MSHGVVAVGGMEMNAMVNKTTMKTGRRGGARMRSINSERFGGMSLKTNISLILAITMVFSIAAALMLVWPSTASAADWATVIHNSVNTGSTKWASVGGWGIQNGKYGEFVCETCHVRNASNIKRIRSTITTPDTSKGTLPGDGRTVVFDRTSGAAGSPNTFGDDTNAPRTTSSKICEI
jgi:hypothetical protein